MPDSMPPGGEISHEKRRLGHREKLGKIFVFWLGIVFGAFVWSSNSGEKPAAPADPLRGVERLVVVAKYAADVPEEVRRQILDTASGLEMDPVVRRVIDGEEVSREELEKLSRVYQLIGRQSTDPSPGDLSELRELAREGILRFALSGLGLLGISLVTLLGFFWPKPKRVGKLEIPESQVWETLGLFFFWHLGGFFLAVLFHSLASSVFNAFVLILSAQFIVYSWLLALLFAARGRFKELPFRRFDARWVSKGYLLAIASLVTINLVETFVRGKPGQSENPVLSVFDGAPLWQYVGLGLLVVVLGPFFEELVFRGWVYAGLTGKIGERKAMLISAALFAVIHGDAPALIPLFVLGMIFAWVYRKSGSLWASVLLHAMWNATTFSLLISVMP